MENQAKNGRILVPCEGKQCLPPLVERNIRYSVIMGSSLHLFHKNGVKQLRKRVFPRYPFTFMVFKADEKVFQVKDISYRGMQISLKDGEHGISPGDDLTGELHWKGETLAIRLQVKWADEENVGGTFERGQVFEQKIHSFFCVENILKGLRPLHLQEVERGLPANLKYWFKSDGSVEFFVWRGSNKRISSFQGIILDKFFEWEEGRGIWTGRILKHQDLETPLDCQEEFFFEEDATVNPFVVDFAHKVFSQLPREYLTDDDREFILFHLD